MKDRMANGDWISQSGQKLYQTAYEEKTKLKPGDIINFVYHRDKCFRREALKDPSTNTCLVGLGLADI